MQNIEELLSQLNDSQRAAVEYIDGPSLVIAGAGSGKTRVLTYKIAYLLQKGMKPWNILALTFTNKAATEMKERIAQLVNEQQASRLRMGTFHSVFAHILRTEAFRVGYKNNFTIYDETDSRSLLKAIIKELQLDDKIYKPASVHSRISMAKNHLVGPEQYAADQEAMKRDKRANMGELLKIYTIYNQRCRQANAMDFDDLLVNIFQLFCEHDDVRQRYAEMFHYVLVDEYQDTNYVQQCIVDQLTKERQCICAVGDDSQSIYSFRGANIDNILNFRQHYPNAQLFKLEQNYRSTQKIVQAANSLIRHNRRQIPKEVFSRNDEGESIIYRPVYSDKEEAAVVCNEIKRIKRQEHCSYGDFAVLYRTNSQSRSIEEEFNKQRLPYHIYGGMSFYQRKEIKDIVAYFRLVVNSDDEEALKRIINYPTRGIGATTLSKIIMAAQEYGVSLWMVLTGPANYSLKLQQATLRKLEQFRSLIASFAELAQTMDAYTLALNIIKQSGISADIYSGTDTEALSKQENVNEFLSAIQDFVEERREEGDIEHISLSDYLQQIALLTDLDNNDKNEGEQVTLMTIHAAKGLEFPTVFIVGMEENIFPSPMSVDSLRGLEEERRLLYVALTRAEKHCIMTSAKNRWRYGQIQFDEPSRFLHDIDPRLLTVLDESASAFGSQRGSRSEPDYKVNQPYIGSYEYEQSAPKWSARMQNSRPVASQFMADPQPKMTGNMRSLGKVTAQRIDSSSKSKADTSALVSIGQIIEHQRFGIGEVVMVEGTGESTKATVEFRNAGRKQLLLKFARFTIIK